MLSFTDPQWNTLKQRFGTAEDVPRLLAALVAADDDDRAPLWAALWSLLHDESGAREAAFAAVPHLVHAAESLGIPLVAHFAAQVEVSRASGQGDALPTELLPDYAAAIDRLPALVGQTIDHPWDADRARVFGAALLVGKRQPALAALLLAEPDAT